MENNAYNRMIAQELDGIVRNYVNYQQKTGKEMREDSLVPLTKPLTSYGKGQKGGSFFDDVLGTVSGAVKTAAQFAPLLALGKKGRRKGGEIKTVPTSTLTPANIRAPAQSVRSGNGSYARAIGSGAMDSNMFEKKAGSIWGSIIPFGSAIGLGENGQVAGKRKRGRPRKAGSLISSLIPAAALFGLGEDGKVAGKRKPGRPKKQAGSLLGSIVPFGNLLGLGEDGQVAGKRKPGRPKKQVGGLFGSMIPFGNPLGLGEDGQVAGRKRGRPRKAGSIGVDLMAETKNNLLTQKKKGGSFLSDLVGAVQSVPSAVRQTKGVARDIQDIQNMLKGKQTRTKKTRTRRTRKGGNIFDDIVSGVGSVVKTTAETLPHALQLGKMFGMGENENVGGISLGDIFSGVKSTIRSVPGALKQGLDVARDVKDIQKILKGGKAKGKTSKWIEHCKAFAKKNKMSFKDAMKDPRCKNSYKK